MSHAELFTTTADKHADTPSHWVEAMPLSEIPPGGRHILRAVGKQILLVRTETDIHACNNRCPHEGYPLMEGSVSSANAGCVLTCNWHNWKFDLVSGETLVGGDVLRRYPIEIRDGVIWLDVADPPAERMIEAALDNLKDSFEDHEYDRMGREIARLAKAGGDPLDAVRHAIRWTHQRFEFGTTHALAAAPDWLALRARLAGDDPSLGLVPLLEIVGHLCWDSLRWREFPFPEGSKTFNPDALVQAIESEDEAGAMAMVRGAFENAGGVAVLDGPISRAAAAHYQDFGHSMIYSYKARQLVDALGADMAETIYLTLARSLVYASREDLIPEFRAYAETRAAWDGSGNTSVGTEDFRHLGVKLALAKTLSASSDLAGLFDALVTAAAWQMLHFDMHYTRVTPEPEIPGVR